MKDIKNKDGERGMSEGKKDEKRVRETEGEHEAVTKKEKLTKCAQERRRERQEGIKGREK